MTMPTRIASEPGPLSPEAIILDLNRRRLARWTAGETGRIGRDGKAQPSNLIGIHEALKIVFGDAARGYAWIKAPNQAATGVRPST